MYEELLAAFIIGISFSNAWVCILLGFSTTSGTSDSAEQKNVGLFFILGRFLGLMILGMVIVSLGFIFEGYIFYLLLLFAAFTIVFGLLIIFKVYHRIKNHGIFTKVKGKPSEQCNNAYLGAGSCIGKSKTDLKTGINPKGDMTKSYGFFLGVFRGATPCIKVLILAPLLLVSPLDLAIMMVLVFTAATTTYPVIGFLSANLFKNFRKYDTFVQTVGAVMLIGIGIFMMLNELAFNNAIIGV